MQQFYTLEEAAEILGFSPDKVKEMARKGDLRAFQDRGTLRFRSQEIDERARSLGRGSEPDLPLGESVLHAPEKASPRRTQAKPPVAEDETFLLADDGDVPLGQTPPKAAGHSSSKSGSRKPSAPPPMKTGHKEPPKAASDSDVRLVLDNNELDFNLADVSPSTPAKKDSNTRLRTPAEPSDSDVKLDSADKMGEHDVPLGGSHRAKTLSDSDIRLEGMGTVESSGKHEPIITEDIDLDAESARLGGGETVERHSPKTRLPVPPPLPTSSPFELSGTDLGAHKVGKSTKGPKAPAKAGIESSEDFELKPGKEEDSSPLILGSSEMDLMVENDADLTGAFNLEEEKKKSTSKPKPKPAGKQDVDSSSEFEISLDDSDGSSSGSESDSDSEFELSLDIDSSTEMKALDLDAGSDSEFELTLDEAESSSIDEEEKDIFATDFEVPALDDESGSEVAALDESDTDLEGSSEFELSLSEDDVAMDSDESGELVEVEESADAAAATIARPRKPINKRKPADEEEEVDLESAEDDIEPLEDEESVGAPIYAPETPATWGAMPGVVLIFSTIFLFLGGLLSYEMVQNMMGYQTGSPASSMVIKPLARMIDDSIPKD